LAKIFANPNLNIKIPGMRDHMFLVYTKLDLLAFLFSNGCQDMLLVVSPPKSVTEGANGCDLRTHVRDLPTDLEEDTVSWVRWIASRAM
jgi:hypothetical protein